MKLAFVLVIKIIYFCHNVNRFFGQRISGTDKGKDPLPSPSRSRFGGARQGGARGGF
jgi:hypothetical protein